MLFAFCLTPYALQDLGNIRLMMYPGAIMENETLHHDDKSPIDKKHSPKNSVRGIYILSGLLVTVILAGLVYFFAFSHRKTQQNALYVQTESWDIPGGQGRSIVIKPDKASEQDLFSLGELLKQESTIYTNAFVYVYDDAEAAHLRKVCMEGKPTPEEALKHDEHFKGLFSKVGEQKNVFDVFFAGSRGNNNKRLTF